MPTLGIIGAGFAGLSAAHAARQAGWQVTLIDKGAGPGGRAATRYLVDRSQCVDSGAQFWTTRDPRFLTATRAWESAGWVRTWSHGFPIVGAEGICADADGFARWCAVRGMRDFMTAWAGDLPAEYRRTVTAVQRVAGRWSVTSVVGDAVRGPAGAAVATEYDAVIATQPLPQAVELLTKCGLPVAPVLRQVEFEKCLYLVAEHNTQLAPIPAPGGLRIDHPDIAATWIASARQRQLRTIGDGIILHANPTVSAQWWDVSSETQTVYMQQLLQQLCTALGTAWEPQRLDVRRWGLSKCRNPLAEPYAVVADGLVLAGDAFGAAPRVEGAWLSGLAAVDHLSDHLSGHL